MTAQWQLSGGSVNDRMKVEVVTQWWLIGAHSHAHIQNTHTCAHTHTHIIIVTMYGIYIYMSV